MPVKLLAVAVDGAGNPYPIDDLQDPNAVISSLTLQPTIGLRFGASYRLVLTDTIVDRDTPTPEPLTPFDSSFTTFTTFTPEEVGSSEETRRSAGLVVLDDRAYLAETVWPHWELAGVFAMRFPVSSRSAHPVSRLFVMPHASHCSAG